MGIKIQTEKKFVAFLDVLGFSNKVLSKKTEKLEKYFDIIEDCLNQVKNIREEIKYIAISDSIILTIDNDGNNIKKFLAVISYIQCKLAINSIWIRGGVSYGEMHFDTTTNVIVGNALIDAVNLEKQAIYPRVILSPKIVTLLSSGDYRKFISYCNSTSNGVKLIHDYNVTSKLRITQNDAIFISYPSYHISQALKSKKKFNDSHLKLVFDSIKEGLFSEQSHYVKYQWLKNFYQESISEISFPVTKDTVEGKFSEDEIFIQQAHQYLGTLG